jgi:hypothetical protein
MMSPVGTKRKCRGSRNMSAIGSKAEDICSQRVFRILTQTGSRPFLHGRFQTAAQQQPTSIGDHPHTKAAKIIFFRQQLGLPASDGKICFVRNRTYLVHPCRDEHKLRPPSRAIWLRASNSLRAKPTKRRSSDGKTQFHLKTAGTILVSSPC